MKQGPDKVLECPLCSAPAIIFTLLSGNTVDARTWTDGKMIAPMLPQLPALTKCSVCAQYYWLAEAKVIGEIPLWGPEFDKMSQYWIAAERVKDLSEFEYLEAIKSNAANNRDQKLYLMTCAWWASNDAIRFLDPKTVENAQIPHSPEAIINLAHLRDTLDADQPYERLLKAETNRELKQFEEALELLKADFPEPYSNTAKIIRKHTEKMDAPVREVIE